MYSEMEPFYKCLNSFERQKKPAEVIKLCNQAISIGLNLVDESIVHGLLMNVYAHQRDFEKAQRELLGARTDIGQFIGLSGQELEKFEKKQVNSEHWHLLDEKVGYKDNIPRINLLYEILTCPVYPISLQQDLSDREKRSICLESWAIEFPSIFGLYSLLGDFLSISNVDYAIKCFKIAQKEELGRNSDDPPTIAEFFCGYKLGRLYDKKGDVSSSAKEYNRIVSLANHPQMDSLSDWEREEADYWTTKAKNQLDRK